MNKRSKTHRVINVIVSEEKNDTEADGGSSEAATLSRVVSEGPSETAPSEPGPEGTQASLRWSENWDRKGDALAVCLEELQGEPFSGQLRITPHSFQPEGTRGR